MEQMNINLTTKTDFNLSFMIDIGKTNWYFNGIKQDNSFISKELKNELPKDSLFNISSLIFNIDSNKEEVLTKYSCFFQESTDSLCILIEEHSKYVDLSKETMINLIDFAQKLGINAIFLLLARKNPEYVKLLQGMMTIGFENDSSTKTTKIEGKVYKVLKMNLKQEDIEELDF